jgi:hypothetical protein
MVKFASLASQREESCTLHTRIHALVVAGLVTLQLCAPSLAVLLLIIDHSACHWAWLPESTSTRSLLKPGWPAINPRSSPDLSLARRTCNRRSPSCCNFSCGCATESGKARFNRIETVGEERVRRCRVSGLASKQPIVTRSPNAVITRLRLRWQRILRIGVIAVLDYSWDRIAEYRIATRDPIGGGLSCECRPRSIPH